MYPIGELSDESYAMMGHVTSMYVIWYLYVEGTMYVTAWY